MDETEDDVRYPSSHYDVNYQPGYGSSDRQKLPIRNASFPHHIDDHGADDGDEDDIEDEFEEEEIDDEEENRVQRTTKDDGGGRGGDGGGSGGSGSANGGGGGGASGGEEDGNDEDDDEDDDISDGNQKDYNGRFEGVELERQQKKRKLKSLISSYEFAPRLTVQSVPLASSKKPFGIRNSLTEWTEHETFVLLDAWGERFIKCGRKSLRSEEWQEVSERVSEESRTKRKDTQCRNRLDTLKKKYKKEKLKLTETGGAASKWVYFSKMDMLMSGLPRGLDSGEYALMNPKALLNKTNGFGVTESSKCVDDDSDGLPPKKKKLGRVNGEGSSVMLLANCIDKFSEIYEKIENSKRQQMLELEKMRMEFHRDLELQKRLLLERAQAEIAKIREDRDEEADDSTENVSG